MLIITNERYGTLAANQIQRGMEQIEMFRFKMVVCGVDMSEEHTTTQAF